MGGILRNGVGAGTKVRCATVHGANSMSLPQF